MHTSVPKPEPFSLHHLALAEPGSDAAQDYYVERLDRAVPRVFRRLQDKISESLSCELMRQLALYESLPKAARREILTHPHFIYWWVKLMERVLARKRPALECWMRDFSRFLLLPAFVYGLPIEFPVALRSRRGEVRFPGFLRHIRIDDSTAEDKIIARLEGDSLALQSERKRFVVQTAALVCDHDGAPSQLIRERRAIPSVGIEIDASDPWVGLLFDSINSRAAAEGRPGDLRPLAPVRDKLVRQFQDAADLLAKAWPEIVSELKAYTRLIVPFRSQHYSTFTESVFMGGVFMSEARQSFESVMYTAEHLLHEHSHLRLTLVLEIDPLLMADSSRTFNSPWRQARRPLSGMLQGLFVFARISRFLRLAEEVTREGAFGRRREEVLRDLRAALEEVRGCNKITYTPMGEALFEQIETEIRL